MVNIMINKDGINLKYLNSALSYEGRRKDYYILYTIVFMFAFLLCFSWLIFSDKSFIWYMDFTGDGWHQHLRALSYYATYLRNIIRHLISEHQLIIPDYDFNIGEGSDILNALHYYVIGDPIALLSVVVPTRYMHYFLSASCVLRLYLSGVAFSELCFGTDVKSRTGILAGSMAYSFSLWGIYCATRHPYFLNPMIYFPLMLLGIEKIIRKEKPHLFIASAAISAMSNFYFFYIIVILAITYAVIRLIRIYRNNYKPGIIQLLQLGGYAVLGVSLSAFILLPVLSMFLQDSRLGSPQPISLFYPLSYYSSLPGSMMSANFSYWLVLGFTAPAVLAAILLFCDRKHNSLLKVYYALCVLIMLFPIAGRFLNGMSYATNRWVWAFALLSSYILALYWDNLLNIENRKWLLLFASSIVYFTVCLHFDKSRSASTFVSSTFLFITLIVIRGFSINEKAVLISTKSFIVFLIVFFSSVNTSLWLFAPSTVAYTDEVTENSIVRFENTPGTWGYSSELIDNSQVRREWRNNEAVVVKGIAGSDYTRYSGRYMTLNAGLSAGVSATNYYWSISNPYVNNYRDLLYMKEPRNQIYHGYDDRTVPNTLAAVEYYTVKEQENTAVNKLKPPYGPVYRENYKFGLPYGFKLIKTINAQKNIKKDEANLLNELGQDKLTLKQKEKLKETVENNYLVYKNQYTLPLGYCYDASITEKDWKALNPAQRQQTLLEAAVIPHGKKIAVNTENYSAPSHDYRVDFDIVYEGTSFIHTNGGFVTTEDDVVVAIAINNPVAMSETYISFDNLGFTPTKQYDLFFGDETVDPSNLYNKTNWDILDSSAKAEIREERDYWDPVISVDLNFESSTYVKKTIHYDPPDAPFSSGRHNFIANMGYSKEPISWIRITLPKRGVYSFDDINIYCVPMDKYEEKINALKESHLENIQLSTDSIQGNVNVTRSKLLCVAIPYSDGWAATIDGNDSDVFCINAHYLGIEIPPGDHVVKLRYRTPYKLEGILISIAGVLALLLLLLFNQLQRQRKNYI